MSRRGLVIGFAVVVAAAAVAALVALVVGRDGGPPVIRLAAGGTMAATDEAAVTAEPAFLVDYRFVLDDGAQFEAGEAVAFRLEPPADLHAAARDLAQRLGVDGEVVPAPYGDGAVQVGATDGSGPSLWVGPSGDWSFASEPLRPEVICVEPAEPAGGDVADERPAVAECEPPAPPAGVPDAAEAERAATAFLAGLELPVVPQLVDVHADEWGAWVSATLPVDGRPTDLWVGVSLGADAVVTSANGTLARPVEVGRYPTVDADTAVARMADQQVWPLAYDGLVGAPGADTPVSDVTEADVDPDTPVEAPAVEVPAIDEPDDTVSILPAPDPDSPPEVVEVRLVAAGPALLLTVDADGAWWLLPGVRFTDAEGGVWPVLTVADDYLDAGDGQDASGGSDGDSGDGGGVDPEPMPEPVPADPGPEPGQAEPGDAGDDVSPDGDDPAAEKLAEELVGLPEDDAVARIEEAGFEVRVVARDGEHFAVTEDYRPDRLNLTIQQGRVLEASVG